MGHFYTMKMAKLIRRFGPDDADALKLIKDKVDIIFVSADHRGFPISEKRVNDMGFQLENVKAKDRLDWMASKWDLKNVIYMGDSFVDIAIFNEITKAGGTAIMPNDGFYYAKEYATYVTHHNGGSRAVAEAVFWILKEILSFTKDEIDEMIFKCGGR